MATEGSGARKRGRSVCALWSSQIDPGTVGGFLDDSDNHNNWKANEDAEDGVV